MSVRIYNLIKMENLNNTKLFRQKAYINGEWIAAENGATYNIVNPYDHSVIAKVPDMGEAETRRGIIAANAAFPKWKAKTAGERSIILRRWYELQMEYLEDLAYILTMEQGKPINEARSEIRYGASFVEWFAEEGKRAYGDVIPAHGVDKRIIVIKQPIGVVAAITPWNFPNAMITRKVAPALAAGCTVIIKPAEDTPLSALALAELAAQAGFPPGVLNIVTTKNPVEVGHELTANPIVRKLSFTGSTQVGKLLMRQCADSVKKVSLELGGNAPFIVFEDADIDAAVAGAIASKYRNAGQTCVCANRIYVQSGIYDAFVEKLAKAVKLQKVGHGLNDDVTIGPLINKKALEKVEYLVANALEAGAKLVTGGKRHDLGGTFYEPTILANVNAKMSISQEEIFGPVAPVYRFETEDEVIRLANDTPYGLAAYFYGQNINRVWKVAEALEYGMVGINTGMISTPVAPFGGMKQSGIGREGSKYGLEEFMEVKYLCFG
jgi:succinate-semialdehyde dehydrogenase/glutarate-semialdehyde dehydrogenase